jgi:BirA family biotin operon repressor/biotin-[acetyl-CoA-carboxylase] ligase
MPGLSACWRPHELWEALRPLVPGLTVEVVAQTDSTNTQLLQRVRTDSSACLLVAEHQTAGRGRQGRVWTSQPLNSLTFSWAMPYAPKDWSGLSLAVGLALLEALDPDHRYSQLGLKWPNDLCVAQVRPDFSLYKLGGILIETAALRAAAGSAVNKTRWMVVGVGLNIQAFQWADANLSSSAWSCGPVALQNILPHLNAVDALHLILPQLIRLLLQFEQSGMVPLLERFNARHLLQGQSVRVAAGSAVEGRVVGLNAQGALCVQTKHGFMHTIHSGEVQYHRSADVHALALSATKPVIDS